MTRFYIQDQGIFIPTNDLAQAFAALNFTQINSFGIGTDTIIPIVNTDNPNWIADIQSQDLWGYTGSGNNAPIYRLTNVGIGYADPTERFQVGATGIDLVVTTAGLVGIGLINPAYKLDVKGTVHASDAVEFDSTLDVDGDVTFNSSTSSTTKDTGALIITNGGVGIAENLNVGGYERIYSTLTSTDQNTGALVVDGGTGIKENLNVGGKERIYSTESSTDQNTGALTVDGGTGIKENLNVGENTRLYGTLKLDSSLIDINSSTALGKFDYRLSSVGTGVSWRPPGVQTENAIWVTIDGNDANSGYLEGDAKRTVGAAASIAQPGDTIFIRSGVYYENNPIGLRTDVAVSGQDLRLVTIVPQNLGKDIFHVRRGCLIENLNFSCDTGQSNPGGGALAFPPITADIISGKSYAAVTGYTAPGPATEGSSGRWRSPYVRNCTNFMPLSIGMKIDGNHATASTIGADLKCMVCDSFTQYNEAGIGVSITNNGYAQLVSIFTINCDIAIYTDTGGQCDLTNSNSSFGNYGLVSVGLGATEFTGTITRDTAANSDTVGLTSVFLINTTTPRRPYDGQALWFKINLNNYPESKPYAVGSGVISAPMNRLGSITVKNSLSIYSSSSPPSIIIQDIDGTFLPKGPQGIVAEASPNIDDNTGKIVSIDVISSGRNYLSTQDIRVIINGDSQLTTNYVANMEPIYFTVSESTPVTSPTGITTTTFNEFVPYELFTNDAVELKRISRILTSSHSFEYIGAGTNINTATPQSGGVPIKANEIVARDGAQIPFTSTDQKGNFDIGQGLQINQTTSTISGRDFSRAIQAEVTPLILALR